MKRNLIIILLVCTLSLFGALYDTLYTTIPAREIPTTSLHSKSSDDFVKKPAPALPFTDTKKRTTSLKALEGKIVLLNFWASWCRPCKQEFPSMLNLVEKFKGDIVLVAVSTDRNKQDITRFIQSLNNPMLTEQENIHIVWDKDHAISQDSFNILRMPETIIISPQGNMTRKIVGEIIWDSPQMLSYFNHLLQNTTN